MSSISDKNMLTYVSYADTITCCKHYLNEFNAINLISKKKKFKKLQSRHLKTRLTLRVTVGSRCALEMRCPRRVLVRRKRKRMFVALVKSLRVWEKVKFFAPGRPFIKDTTT